MIVLDSFNKIDILYRNYVKQFSKAYIEGSNLYVGDSLKNVKYFRESIRIQNIIKTYKNIFIKLYMNNNKIYEEINNENLCVICLEDLNDEVMDVCHKCNVKCHIKCLCDWHKKNNEEICPICLQTEEYYLNILENGNNNNENNNENNSIQNVNDNNSDNLNNLNDIENNTINDRTDLENFVIVYEPNKRLKACLTIFCFMGLIFLVVFIDNNYR